jgi:hypothetical protein
MRLSASPIKNFSNINDFQYSSQWTIRATDPNTLYFQLVDLDKTSGTTSSAPLGSFMSLPQSMPQRYIAGIGVPNQPTSIVVTFPSLDPTQTLTASATQNPNDGSIWSLSLAGSVIASQAPSSGNVQFAVTEGSTVRYFSVMGMIAVETLNNGSC